MGKTRTEFSRGQPTAAGIETRPESTITATSIEHPVIRGEDAYVTHEAAHVLIETLFAGSHQHIPGIRYSIAYRLAEGRTGGDIIDVFHYDNDKVSFAIADISGKGSHAAAQAALIKYSLRAFASTGMGSENAMRVLNRLYLENNAFENTVESYATAFFGTVDASRRFMQYANAAHEPAMLIEPSGEVTLLDPTAPLLGIFDDQHHLFKQNIVAIAEGSLFLAATDGITEARNDGDLFGLPRLIDLARAHRDEPEASILEVILGEVDRFAGRRQRDDIAIIAARFL